MMSVQEKAARYDRIGWDSVTVFALPLKAILTTVEDARGRVVATTETPLQAEFLVLAANLTAEE